MEKEEFKEPVKKQPFDFKKNILMTIYLLGLGTLVFLLIAFFTNQKNGVVGNPTYTSVVDGGFIAGSVIIFCFLLSLLNRFGAFDTFGYSFSALLHSFNPEKEKKYVDLVEYKDKKNIKRSKTPLFYVPYLVSGVILLIVTICIYLFGKGLF